MFRSNDRRRDGPARGFALRAVLVESVRKLDPRRVARNPVMFVVWIGSAFTTALWLEAWLGPPAAVGDPSPWFTGAIASWLWLTVWFATLAEAFAEGRGKAQAESLRAARRDLVARRLAEPRADADAITVPAAELLVGEHVLVRPGEMVPSDGEVVEGVASVDESAITGESAPVIRESGGDRSSVTGGTRVLSDWIVVRITAVAGGTFLDRMIALVEGAKRRKTPNEIALDVLLAGLTLVFLLATATLYPYSRYAADVAGAGAAVPLATLVALLVCLIPTTIGGLLSAIGIAGMDRLLRVNVVATSGKAVEAAGDIDVLLLDKTGTITLGNRQAVEMLPAPGIDSAKLADSAQLASLADETPEGRSIVVLAKERFGLRQRDVVALGARFVPFSATTRVSGVDVDGRTIRKGAADAIERLVVAQGGSIGAPIRDMVQRIARSGGTPLVVADGPRALGVIHLKDVVKGGIRERFAALRGIGIKTVMVTGDNALTAAAIAAEAGVDDFLAQATPENKLDLIRRYQDAGNLVAMTGDGTNDAPALAKADVAVAMNTGTQAAKEAGNMVDLDSDPTKLLDVVEIGKQLLMTRGALTTFSIANDVAKYFAILPAAFAATYPQLGVLDVMRLGSPESAILAAVVFNALILIALVPLALKGVVYRPRPAAATLSHHLLVYGVGGLVAPFVGIKAIDLILAACGLD